MTNERRDLRSMKRKQPPAGAAPAANPKSATKAQPMSDEQRQQMDQVKQMAKPYENRSRDQLLQDATRIVKDGKRNGTIDASKLDGYLKMMGPMLNASQRSEMSKLIEQLKRT